MAEASEYRAQYERRQKTGERISAEASGYMELAGAVKDAGCQKVSVPGGVSEEKGCCNLFEPEAGAVEFECGSCTHHTERRD